MKLLLGKFFFFDAPLISDNYVVDWYVDEFYKESDEAHDAETDSSGNRDLLELFSVGFCATLN